MITKKAVLCLMMIVVLTGTLGCGISKKEYLKLETSHDDMAKQVESLIKEKADLQKENNIIKGEIEELKNSNDALKGEIESSQGDLGSKILALDAENVKLKKQLSSKAQSIEEISETHKKLIENLKKEIEDKNITIEKLDDRLNITFANEILFTSGSTEISEEGKQTLKSFAESIINEIASYNVLVVGHTDNKPLNTALKEKYVSNWGLSSARATSVVHLLTEENNIDPASLYTIGRSYYTPKDSNDTKEGREKNRRVEIKLLPKSAGLEF